MCMIDASKAFEILSLVVVFHNLYERVMCYMHLLRAVSLQEEMSMN